MAEELRILYEDPYLVVCVKPVGVLSEDSESGRSLPRMLAEHYRQAGKPDYIATVHRLDKIVGGVMVLSRRREVTGRLTTAIAAHEITKEYLAVLRGHPQEPAATLTDLLFRDASHNKSYVVKRMRKGVREARLSYEEVGRTEELSLVRVQLYTGRTHQIRVHMAHMDIHFTHSTNGVAALHTEILKNSELHGFYELYPEKFNNKTNGITFRRWLLECDPRLTAALEQHIGSGFRKDAAELEKLLAFADDEAVLDQLTAVKKANKEALADWLLRTQKVSVNTDAVFDIQSKRLHEYKRQQLNLLYLIHQYYEIKAGHLPAAPLVSIFGAKAAPAYTIAKDIIHALLTLSKVIAADPEVSKWLQVVFVENYNVTAAEKLIPACDLSEQISLASKEASGTGNMKFMLNGALTLGTMDGANVEISQQVGEENIYIFGQTSDQVIHRYAVGDYDPAQWVEGDANIRRAINFLTGPEMLAAGHAENLTRLHNELIHKDWFQTLPDFNAYVVRKGQALSDYACDPKGWRRKCLVNIAKAGMFSSDRTIAEYDRDIWHLGK